VGCGDRYRVQQSGVISIIIVSRSNGSSTVTVISCTVTRCRAIKLLLIYYRLILTGRNCVDF